MTSSGSLGVIHRAFPRSNTPTVLGQKKVQLPQDWFGTQQWPPSVTLRDPNAMTSCETVCIYRHISHGNRKSLTREFKIPLSFLRSRRRIKNDKRTMGADGDWHLVPAYLQATGLQVYRLIFSEKCT